MLHLVHRVFTLLLLVTCLSGVHAANESRPVVGPGATKDDVIDAYGWPNGHSRSGTKEILSYAQGEVLLENGRVERVNFSPNVPWQAPKPRPAPATASTRKVPEAPVDYWVTSLEAAKAQAQRRNSRILALFTGSDWSPASRQFREEVEYDPEFVNAFAGDFVFVKFDFPRGNPVPATISEENLRLRERYGVTTYPTFLVLSSAGELLARVDLEAARAEMGFRDRVIAAVRKARAATSSAKPARAATAVVNTPAPAVPVPVEPAEVPPPVAAAESSSPAANAMFSAGRAITIALAFGAALVLFAFWRLWRQPRSSGGQAQMIQIADRIDAAAGGMPSLVEMNRWSKEKLRAVTAALAEFDNYTALLRPVSDDIDVELRKRGDVKPRALVCCSPGAAGVVSAKRVRELFASLAAEGVETGWFVSPAGFSPDAREYAAAHRITLVNSDGLHAMMREVPPVSLPAVLART